MTSQTSILLDSALIDVKVPFGDGARPAGRGTGHPSTWLPCNLIIMMTVIIIKAVISAAPYLTDNGEPTALYKSNENV